MVVVQLWQSIWIWMIFTHSHFELQPCFENSKHCDVWLKIRWLEEGSKNFDWHVQPSLELLCHKRLNVFPAFVSNNKVCFVCLCLPRFVSAFVCHIEVSLGNGSILVSFVHITYLKNIIFWRYLFHFQIHLVHYVLVHIFCDSFVTHALLQIVWKMWLEFT